MAAKTAQVLVVGAGPTGLVLALQLARRGIDLRIVDRAVGPGEASRAIAVHARTLEFYDQLGFAGEAVRRGIPTRSFRVFRRSREAGVLTIGDAGVGISPFPFVLALPQDDHERLLNEQLDRLGVRVERSTELRGLEALAAGTRATLRRAGGAEETVEVAYLCGCDGARSAVREGLGIGFPGGTYEQAFFVADVRPFAGGSTRTLDMHLGEDGFCLVLPVRQDGRQRLIGILPEGVAVEPGLAFADIAAEVHRVTGVDAREADWFSTYRVHHRVADRFRSGDAFLLGDAGHIHSPAGGQGMNTGIGDAVNLGWKLADVLRGRSDRTLLDSYEAERIGFARRLVATTDQAFQLVASRSALGRLWRMHGLPRLLPALSRAAPIRRLLFRTVSQTAIHYRDGPIGEGAAGTVRAGDRLPWVHAEDGRDNYADLRSLDWQLHVYGQAPPALRERPDPAPLVRERLWDAAAERAGLQKDAVYLVRPDGHVAFAAPAEGAGRLGAFLSERGLRLGPGVAALG